MFYWAIKSHGTCAAVEVLLQHLVDLRGERDVVVGELAPGHEQEGEGVVVEAVIPVHVGRHLQQQQQLS